MAVNLKEEIWQSLKSCWKNKHIPALGMGSAGIAHLTMGVPGDSTFQAWLLGALLGKSMSDFENGKSPYKDVLTDTLVSAGWGLGAGFLAESMGGDMWSGMALGMTARQLKDHFIHALVKTLNEKGNDTNPDPDDRKE